MGQLDLEAHSDGVVPLLTGDVKDEPAKQTHRDKVSNRLQVFTSAFLLEVFCIYSLVKQKAQIHTTLFNAQKKQNAKLVCEKLITHLLHKHSITRGSSSQMLPIKSDHHHTRAPV